jgi:very-short-patch-repair endonuclease
LEISYLEEAFERVLIRHGLGNPVREFKFHGFRFDFAWPALLIAVEVDGGTFCGGNHVRGKGYQRDCVKHNLAQLEGWAVLRADREMVGSDEFATVVKKMIQVRLRCLKRTARQQ